jgi:hypothetical protein
VAATPVREDFQSGRISSQGGFPVREDFQSGRISSQGGFPVREDFQSGRIPVREDQMRFGFFDQLPSLDGLLAVLCDKLSASDISFSAETLAHRQS